MRYTFAPLEGITNCIYRSAHAKYFPGVDSYYTPFIAPNSSHKLTTREMRDVLPEFNKGHRLIPQVLTKNADDFVWCAEKLASLGYDEVDLNLGCPSGTVVSKGKGAGQLADTDALDAFFYDVFRRCPIAISVKTRIGLSDKAELPRLLSIFRRYPFKYIIVHPRTRDMLYKGVPDDESFALALEGSPFPVAWNGNVFSVSDAKAVEEKFPTADHIMIGRGFIADPGLSCALTGHEIPGRETYRAFADEIFEGYMELWNDKKAVVCHMKEMWSYMIACFEDSDKYAKMLRKASTPEDYRAAVGRLFDERDISHSENWAFRRL